ncbi:Glucoamylase [Thalassocella blandensis]|nr:Glucoamylase [Thalassocella blandensis]
MFGFAGNNASSFAGTLVNSLSTSMPRSIFLPLVMSVLGVSLSGCNSTENDFNSSASAPGAPGQASTWAYSGKTGIGTSFEQYLNEKHSAQSDTGAVSKVWFSLAQGIITETMYGLIHEAQIKEIQFYVKGEDFFDEEKTATRHRIEYLHKDAQGRPLSLAYKIISDDIEGKYTIEKSVFTDPDHNTLMMQVAFTAHEKNIQPYLMVNPHMGNTGEYDKAWRESDVWYAQDEKTGTSLSIMSDAAVAQSNVGFIGNSTGLQALQNNQDLPNYQNTGSASGNVGVLLAMPALSNSSATWLYTFGFGDTPKQSRDAAQQSLNRGFKTTLAHYNGEGTFLGWEDYLASLDQLPKLAALTNDKGQLLYTSALVLKAQEDKTHSGALIASLSNPWGDTKSADTAKTGYKAVWPRDFYQVAMAMLALGDEQTPKVAFQYLKQVQVNESTPGFTGTGGWFLQKTHVDGTLEWIAVQLDQTAMPIMLGWKLWQHKILSDAEAKDWYQRMLKPAADFLSDGGKIKLDWSDIDLKPPFTQQERWEEQFGYSPSSMAALIAGLICAGELAELAGDTTSQQRYLQAADSYSQKLEALTFTTQGSLNDKDGDATTNDGRYYLRITQNEDPNDHAELRSANGQIIDDESEILDAGFLELVRYGVRAADDAFVVESLPELDNMQLADDLRVKYMFQFDGQQGEFPGWRRYGKDGYGEDSKTGLAYGAINDQMSDHQRGRVWPFFTGERAHYEFARGKSSVEDIRQTYVKALELFANEGMMLPEQVWDGVGENHYQYTAGEGTNSATPLAWTHAEYIKLLRTLHDQQVWDRYAPVVKRYQK